MIVFNNCVMRHCEKKDAAMRILMLIIAIALMSLFTGCKTIEANEPNAKQAAEWVKQRSGFIENAVQAITHIAVYSTDQGTFERQRTIEILHSISGNLNALIASGKVDSNSIKEALKIDEPYFGPLMDAVANIIHVEIGNFKDNGYSDLTVSILVAVSKGISDGTVE